MNKSTPHERLVELHTNMLQNALEQNAGPRDWRDWKAAATGEVIELANRSSRMQILKMSLEGDLRVAFRVHMPVPRWPVGNQLVIAEHAVFDLVYQEQWRWESPPSFLPLGLLDPHDVFHPNCRPGILPVASPQGVMPLPRVMICLGDLPPGTPPKQIVLLGYFALTLQDHVLDERDPAGVFNPDACRFFRDQSAHLPLTRAGLFDPWPAGTGEAA